MPEVHIRPVTAGDLPAIRGLMRELAQAAEPASDFDLGLLSRLDAAMASLPDIYLNLVAEDEGQVVGFVSIIFYKTFFHRGGTALINELIVSESRRGQGIGRALIERVRQEALNRDLDEVEVGTENDNAAARRFYHRCGFDQEYVLLGMELAR